MKVLIHCQLFSFKISPLNKLLIFSYKWRYKVKKSVDIPIFSAISYKILQIFKIIYKKRRKFDPFIELNYSTEFLQYYIQFMNKVIKIIQFLYIGR